MRTLSTSLSLEEETQRRGKGGVGEQIIVECLQLSPELDHLICLSLTPAQRSKGTSEGNGFAQTQVNTNMWEYPSSRMLTHNSKAHAFYICVSQEHSSLAYLF